MSKIDPTFDATLCVHDPDRWLSSRFVVDPTLRAQLVALYTLDGEWGRVAALAKTSLAGEIRLAWWRDAVESFAGGGPAEHPALAVLGVEAVRALQSAIQATIEARHADLDATAPNDKAAHALMSAAARLLDPATPTEALSSAAHAWSARHTHALRAANSELKVLSVQAFPAIAHVTLVRGDLRSMGQLEKRTRITLAVLRGRL